MLVLEPGIGDRYTEMENSIQRNVFRSEISVKFRIIVCIECNACLNQSDLKIERANLMM